MVHTLNQEPQRLSLWNRVTIEWSRAQIDTLGVAKIGIQKVSGKKFIGNRTIEQQILYAVDEKKNEIYILGAFIWKEGTGLWKRRTAKVTLKYIKSEYNAAMEDLLEQTTDELTAKRKGKKVVFITNDVQLEETLTQLGLESIKLTSTDTTTTDTKTQVEEIVWA